jgi:ABC-2 type transport system ATP-binding protein
MTEAVLEIECERPADAMTVLEKLPAIQEVALFGAALHAVAADEAAARAAATAALGAAGFTVRRIERVPATLEDVFVSLIEARDRAEGKLQEVRR